jgi:hypothetical protein
MTNSAIYHLIADRTIESHNEIIATFSESFHCSLLIRYVNLSDYYSHYV